MIATLLLILTFLFVTPAHAQAYLDAGTGSYITQILIGFIVGGTYLGKVYWHQLTTYINTFLQRKNKDGEEKGK